MAKKPPAASKKSTKPAAKKSTKNIKEITQSEEGVCSSCAAGEHHHLNEKLMDQFSDKIEAAINKVCDKADSDPRMELLITLAIFSAQVAVDTGFDEEDFISLMLDMYGDMMEREEPEAKTAESKIETDPKQLN